MGGGPSPIGGMVGPQQQLRPLPGVLLKPVNGGPGNAAPGGMIRSTGPAIMVSSSPHHQYTSPAMTSPASTITSPSSMSAPPTSQQQQSPAYSSPALQPPQGVGPGSMGGPRPGLAPPPYISPATGSGCSTAVSVGGPKMSIPTVSNGISPANSMPQLHQQPIVSVQQQQMSSNVPHNNMNTSINNSTMMTNSNSMTTTNNMGSQSLSTNSDFLLTSTTAGCVQNQHGNLLQGSLVQQPPSLLDDVKPDISNFNVKQEPMDVDVKKEPYCEIKEEMNPDLKNVKMEIKLERMDDTGSGSDVHNSTTPMETDAVVKEELGITSTSGIKQELNSSPPRANSTSLEPMISSTNSSCTTTVSTTPNTPSSGTHIASNSFPSTSSTTSTIPTSTTTTSAVGSHLAMEKPSCIPGDVSTSGASAANSTNSQSGSRPSGSGGKGTPTPPTSSAPSVGKASTKEYPALFKPDELRQHLAPTMEMLYRQEPDSIPFRMPVDPSQLGIPDYFEIIKKPMDLSTIKRKLDTGQYSDPWDYVDDVWLMFDNAWIYNRKTSRVYRYCTKVRQ